MMYCNMARLEITVWFRWLAFVVVGSEYVHVHQLGFSHEFKRDVPDLVQRICSEGTFLQQLSLKD